MNGFGSLTRWRSTLPRMRVSRFKASQTRPFLHLGDSRVGCSSYERMFAVPVCGLSGLVDREVGSSLVVGGQVCAVPQPRSSCPSSSETVDGLAALLLHQLAMSRRTCAAGDLFLLIGGDLDCKAGCCAPGSLCQPMECGHPALYRETILHLREQQQF